MRGGFARQHEKAPKKEDADKVEREREDEGDSRAGRNPRGDREDTGEGEEDADEEFFRESEARSGGFAPGCVDCGEVSQSGRGED